MLVKSVTNIPLDAHSSKQVRYLPITEAQEDAVAECELPGSQITASGLMTPFPGASGSAPEQPHQSSHNKFFLAQVQMIAQNEVFGLPYLCLAWGMHRIDGHTLRPKSRMTLHCLYRMRALKHRCLIAGQYIHSFPSGHRGARGLPQALLPKDRRKGTLCHTAGGESYPATSPSFLPVSLDLQ